MMPFTTECLPKLIDAAAEAINVNADEVALLDQAIGDGDHVINLQRGFQALIAQREELKLLEWGAAWQKIGMTLMSTIGGASGSLLGTLFVTMAKAAKEHPLDWQGFALVFAQGVEAVKQRGKADAGEKTMLDVLIPVARYLLEASQSGNIMPVEVLNAVQAVALAGVESTRDMIATKGRASFLEERSRGHIDAGAKTSALMICAVCQVLLATPT